MIPVYRSLGEVGQAFGPSAVTIGNFDGVHIGHKHLMRTVVDVSTRLNLKPSVLTFDPHPAKVLAPARAPKLLTKPEQRYGMMEHLGIEQVVELPFTEALSHLSAEAFVKEVLAQKLQARAVVVGENFRFGHRQAGDVIVLRAMGKALGMQVDIVSGVEIRGRMVSSTVVRTLLKEGDVSLACRMLGRPYALEGDIVRGHGIGSKLTVPTLNLATDAELLPAHGVYITTTEDLRDGRQWNSLTNIGTRPTFDGDVLSIETFLLSGFEGLTPERIRLHLLRRVRDERKFPSPEVLKAQISRDVARAQAYFRRTAALYTKT